MPLYEYFCPEGHVTEHLTKYETRSLSRKCVCGLNAEYRISTPRIDYYHMGIDAQGNPTSGDKWERMHRQKLKQEQAA